MHNKTNVLLPTWIFEQAQGDTETIKKLVRQYMSRYEGYTVKSIKNGYAVCEITR